MGLQGIREDFPVLRNHPDLIYLDNACMTLKPDPVIAAIREYYEEYSACGERSIHRLGVHTSEKVDEARERISRFISANAPSEVVFTKNTTEAINLVARSLRFEPGDVVLTTDFEHNSNLAPWHLMHTLRGVRHIAVECNRDVTFNMERYLAALEEHRGSVRLVSMVHMTNLAGTTIPAEEVVEAAHDAGALVLLDAAQSVPHMTVDVRDLGVDMLAFSMHKMCGPTGVGVLYGREDVLERLDPFIVGGSTVRDAVYTRTEFLPPPQRFEAGLQDYAGIIASGAAVNYLSRVGMDVISDHETDLNTRVTRGLSDLENLVLIGPKDPSLRGGIFSFNVEGVSPHDVAMLLDERANIAVRSGTHCAHSWLNAHRLTGSVRASVYLYNTRTEVDIFISEVVRIAEERRRRG